MIEAVDIWQEFVKKALLERAEKMAERLFNEKQIGFGDLSKVDISEITEEMGV